MATPHSFENTLRIHDAAFFNWLGDLRVDYGTVGTEDRTNFPILRIFASPDRAFGAIVDVLVRMCWIDGSTAAAMRQSADDFAVLPLPIATIHRGDPEPNPELRGTPKGIRRRWYNLDTRQWENHPWPAHYRTPYTISFWMMRKYTDAFIREWMMAQFGQKGVAENEVLIPVQHTEPWGTVLQALRNDGSSDNSELEGEEPRWVRMDWSLNLRTWFMRIVDTPADEVQRLAADTYVESASDRILSGDELGEDAQGPTPEVFQSENLYGLPIPHVSADGVLVTTGIATAQPGFLAPAGQSVRHHDLNIQVGVQADTVTLGEWPIVTDSDGVAIFSYAFGYTADGRVELETLQRDSVTSAVVSADSHILPQTQRWEQFHQFVVVRGENGPTAVEDRTTLLLRLAGIGPTGTQDVHLYGFDLRHVLSQTKVAETSLVTAGGFATYTWESLAKRPYLVIIILTTTSGGLNVATFESDKATPSFTVTRSLDSSVNAGAAALMQPDRDSLVLRIPTTMTVEDVYVQVYEGAYRGHTVGFAT